MLTGKSSFKYSIVILRILQQCVDTGDVFLVYTACVPARVKQHVLERGKVSKYT
jgi:hypothetical protein